MGKARCKRASICSGVTSTPAITSGVDNVNFGNATLPAINGYKLYFNVFSDFGNTDTLNYKITK